MKKNFLSYITSRGYSKSTIKGYVYILGRFDDWLSERGKSIDDPESIKLVDIYNFLEELSGSGLSARSCAWIID